MLRISLSIFWPFEIFLLRNLCLVLYHLFRILMSNFLSSLYILKINPLSDVGLVKVFSKLAGYLLVLLTVVLALRSFSVSSGSLYLLLLSVSVLVELYLRSGLLWPCIEDYFLLSLLSGSVWSDLF